MSHTVASVMQDRRQGPEGKQQTDQRARGEIGGAECRIDSGGRGPHDCDMSLHGIILRYASISIGAPQIQAG